MKLGAWLLLALLGSANLVTRAHADDPPALAQSETPESDVERAPADAAVPPESNDAENVPPSDAADRVPPQSPSATSAPAETPEAGAPPPHAGAPARPATMEEVAQESVEEVHFGHVKARYSLNFFGDLSFSVHSPAGPEQKPSFSLGAQDFLVRGELGGHIVATTEFAIEFDEENHAAVDLERLHAGWESEHLSVEAGRTHTDVGYWNQAYHHGKWLQPTIDRPRWIRFEDEGGLLPVHWVGLDGGANATLGPGKLRFSAAIGNGRGKVVDDVRNEYDYSGRKAYRAAIEYIDLAGVEDLRVGVSGIYDRIGAQPASVRPSLPDVPIDEWIAGIHVAYPSVPFLAIAEGYLIEHRAAGHAFYTYGGFALLGYTIESFTPYVELTRIFRSGGLDPFFVPDPNGPPGAETDVLDLIVGLRFDLSDWSALKLEYGFTHLPRRANHSVVLNWSWGF